MQLVHHAFCYRPCSVSAIALKERRFLCRMVSSELNFKNLTRHCADSALLWPCSRERPCKEVGGMCPPAPEGLVGKWHRKAGKLVFKPGSSFFFLKRCIDRMYPPASRDRLSVNVFIVFLPFQTHLVLCAGSQLGKSILSLTQSRVLPLS